MVEEGARGTDVHLDWPGLDPEPASFFPFFYLPQAWGRREGGGRGEGLWVLVVCQPLLGPDWHSGQTGAPSLS